MQLGLGLNLSSGSGGRSQQSGNDFLPGEIEDDGGFVNPPVVVEIGDHIQFKGKKASGASGKFIYNIGQAIANTTYTMLYDPDWSQLGNGGVTAMVGFGLRHAQDFHLSGLKGDGASGILAYKVYGANKWNSTTGFSIEDGGAASFGTQGGPNYLRFAVSEDGLTYSLSTSSDGNSWSEEFTDAVPSPLASIDDPPIFGIAVFLEAADAGPFTVDITLWTVTETDAYEPLASFTGAQARNNSDSASSDFNNVVLTWAAEEFDTSAFFSPTDQQIVIPASIDGRTVIVGAIVDLTGGSAGVDLSFTIRKNGSASFPGAANFVIDAVEAAGLGSIHTQPIVVATGDEFDVLVTTSDTTMVLESDVSSLYIWVVA